MDFTRQMDICAPMALERFPVTLIGTGGIGAAAGVALAKLGVPYMELYDDDIVDDVNIPTQLLRVSDLGKPKVESVAGLMKDLSDHVSGIARPKRVSEQTPLLTPIVISALDSIQARKEVYGAVMGSADHVQWYLDARMAAEAFQLYTVHLEDRGWYSDMLIPQQDGEIPDEPCTAKATIYTAFLAAGHIAHQVKRIVMGEVVPRVLWHDIKTFQIAVPSGEEVV